MNVNNLINLSYHVSFENDNQVKDYKKSDSMKINKFSIEVSRGSCKLTLRKFIDFDNPCYEYTLLRCKERTTRHIYVVCSNSPENILQKLYSQTIAFQNRHSHNGYVRLESSQWEQLIKISAEESTRIGGQINALKKRTGDEMLQIS